MSETEAAENMRKALTQPENEQCCYCSASELVKMMKNLNFFSKRSPPEKRRRVRKRWRTREQFYDLKHSLPQKASNFFKKSSCSEVWLNEAKESSFKFIFENLTFT